MVGHMVYAYFWARMAQVALPKAEADPYYRTKVETARFYFTRLLPEIEMLAKRIKAGSKTLLSLEAELF
jgi:hypothetical protein